MKIRNYLGRCTSTGGVRALAVYGWGGVRAWAVHGWGGVRAWAVHVGAVYEHGQRMNKKYQKTS